MVTTYASEVEQIVQSVFSTMLNIDVARVQDGDPSSRDNLMASVQITGESVWCVVLELSPTATRAATAAMFRIPSQEVRDADQQDAAAELVNMIGGNLKSLLPGPSSLSLPTVITGRECGLRVHDAELIDDVSLCSDVGFLRIRLYTKIRKQDD